MATFAFPHQGGLSGPGASLGSLPFEHSTPKIPPGWSEAIAHRDSFQRWRKDLQLWASGTELDQARIGPAVAQRLEGTAKEVAMAQMERPAGHPGAPGGVGNSLCHGEVMDFGDGLGAVPRSGLDTLVYQM